MREESRSFRPRRRPGPVLAALALLPLLAGLCLAGERGALEGSPFRGRTLFTSKGCVHCHSIWGHGGSLAPDMARAIAGKTLQQLVGEFWNHTPVMMNEVLARGYAWPTLDRQEMADLLSYLYYLRLLDEPGDPSRGAVAFERLRCRACHSLGGEGGSLGGPLDRFSASPSPMPLAQAMWNAGPAMQRAQLGQQAQIPTFSGREMAEIQAYVRERGVRTGGEPDLLPLPDPARGGEVFRIRRCISCHDSAGRIGPDLGRSALRMTVSEISGLLWNHSYAMQERMKALDIPFPRFQDAEMADVISYLYFLGFTREGGDPVIGAGIHKAKGCAACHEKGEAGAPDLGRSAAVRDSISLSAAMWNHAPQMHELMAGHGVAWPKFEPGDMQHLAAYLRTLAARGDEGDE